MFESLKQRMILDESKKINEQSLSLITEDMDEDDELSEIIIDTDGEPNLDYGAKQDAEDEEIADLIDKLSDDDDMENEMALLEDAVTAEEGPDDSKDNMGEASTTDIAHMSSPNSYASNDLDLDIL